MACVLDLVFICAMDNGAGAAAVTAVAAAFFVCDRVKTMVIVWVVTYYGVRVIKSILFRWFVNECAVFLCGESAHVDGNASSYGFCSRFVCVVSV